MSRSEEETLKQIESRLISELMKNSRRSDRELARVLGISQPTVGRMIRKLEKQGVIKEYTIIPDFAKLGYELMGITLGRYSQAVTPEQRKEAHEVALEQGERPPIALLMLEQGLGLNSDIVAITLYKNYSEYTRLMHYARKYSFVDTAHLETFLINLNAQEHYRSLTLSVLAQYMLSGKTTNITQ
jgi:DNA-binding Lrp family transcriptional regulator